MYQKRELQNVFSIICGNNIIGLCVHVYMYVILKIVSEKRKTIKKKLKKLKGSFFVHITIFKKIYMCVCTKIFKIIY